MPPFPYITISGSIFVALAILFSFISKQLINNPRKKVDSDRVLLRKLLEGFGLDIPSELKDQESKVIRTIKTP